MMTKKLTFRGMILIIDNKQLGYKFEFNQREGDLIQGLIDSFITAYSAKTFKESSMVAIRHGDFFYIIKNIYGNLSAGVLLSDFSELINDHLNL